MKRVVVAVIMVLALALPVVTVAAKPAPSCSVSGAAPSLTLTASRLQPNTTYRAWWTVAAVDDGPPFYQAALSGWPSDRHGRWGAVIETNGRSGWWYFYVVLPGDEYGKGPALAVCEFQG